jgi:hypothetical protein
METEELTRKELYDLVWSEPLTSLGRRFEISDNGIRKTCKRLNIPLPRNGHWQKIAAGKRTWVGKYVEVYSGNEKIVWQKRNPDNKKEIPIRPTSDTFPNVDFSVSAQLICPDKLVIEAGKILYDRQKDYSKRNPEYDGLLNCWEGLAICVTSKNINRALCLMDSLIRILKLRGHKVVVESGTQVVIGEEKFKIVMKEKTTRSIIANGTWNTTIHTPNGKLGLKIDGYGGKEWKDGKTTLEEQFPEILFKFEEKGKEMMLETIERERRRRERELEEKLKGEREELEEKELHAFRNLMAQALQWQNSVMLNNYLNEMERQMISNSLEKTDEIQMFLEWARKKMQWYDPMVNAPDELLDGVDKHTLKTEGHDAYGFYRGYSSDDSSNNDNFWKPFWAKR